MATETTKVLDAEELELTYRYWSACNFMSAAMI